MSKASRTFTACAAWGTLVFACLAKGCASEDTAMPHDSGVRDANAPLPDGGGPEAEAAAPSISSSRGSGGIPCTSERKVDGRRVCVASAGGSEFRFVAPAEGAAPSSLVVYVHGDGARAYASDSALRVLAPWAEAHHGLAVAVLSPNGCAWWQKASQTNCAEGAVPDPDSTGQNADALKAVLDTFRQRYDIVTSRAYFYGASGGSIFLTSSFLRRFGNLYPGAYALNCGGTAPGLAFAWNADDPTMRASTKLYFTYGDKDFLKSEIELAIPFFRSTGFRVDTQVIPNAEHCAFDAHGRAVSVFDAFVGEFGE